MKNWSEEIRMDLKSPTGSSASTVVNASSDIYVKDGNTFYDNSSSGDAFSGLSAGNVIKVSGYGETLNDRIFTVTDKESNGLWIKVDKSLKDVPASEVPSAGITVETPGETITVNSDMTKYDEVLDVVNLNSASSDPADMTGSDFGVNHNGTVSCFATTESNDQLLFIWKDSSRG